MTLTRIVAIYRIFKREGRLTSSLFAREIGASWIRRPATLFSNVVFVIIARHIGFIAP